MWMGSGREGSAVSEFVPFRFRVNLYNSSSNQLLCSGAFSEVTGFELTMEPKAIQEGGRNWGELQRNNIVVYHWVYQTAWGSNGNAQLNSHATIEFSSRFDSFWT